MSIWPEIEAAWSGAGHGRISSIFNSNLITNESKVVWGGLDQNLINFQLKFNDHEETWRNAGYANNDTSQDFYEFHLGGVIWPPPRAKGATFPVAWAVTQKRFQINQVFPPQNDS